ncbi:hypothetical protein OHB35_44510 [Streptomyces phaeochromogenes]|uniref:FMN-binding domain-containing protein n=1 Tax=Streptomyces phaeochromogenes TaxID=1923 RepID=A0ABZ1HR88_STRPH|nr:hypothetical protein [Streptomyces phaeochromogenes]WSD19735.1 hypothetical protein OHB35_44510 [Streptomyces phaeochromogenes]
MSALNKKITTTLMGISVTAAIASCMDTGTDTDSASSPSASNVTSAPSRSPSNGGPYEDGEYTVDGEYGTRGSSIGVSLTLDDDEITVVDVTPHATDETSLALQRRFAEAVPALVVGKDIDDVNLDRVAGNSATPAGFNDALEKIKAEASG